MPDEHSAPTAPARTFGEPPRPAAARQAQAALLTELPLDALPVPARRHAEHLTAALHAVTVPRPGDTASVEPPEPVLAAFRAAHAERAAGVDAVGAPPRRTGARGRARGLGPGSWARSTRLAAAGVLSIGMIGGVAVAAGAGALTSPFPSPVDERAPLRRGTAAPAPAGSPHDGNGQGPLTLSTGEPTAPTTRRPPSTTPSPAPYPSQSASPPPDTSAGPAPRGADGGGTGTGRRTPDVLRPCRDLRRGRPLDVVALRGLARAAHGAAQVPEFCRILLGLPPGPWQNIVLPPGSPIPLTPGDALGPEAPVTSPAVTETAPGSLPTYGYGGMASPTQQEPGTPQATDAGSSPTGSPGEPGPDATPSAASSGDGRFPAGDPTPDHREDPTGASPRPG